MPLVNIANFNAQSVNLLAGELWGFSMGNTYGDLGVGDAVSHTTLVQIGTDSDWLDVVDMCSYSKLGIKADNSLYVWGRGNYSATAGSLGLGGTTDVYSPTSLPYFQIRDPSAYWSNSGSILVIDDTDGSIWGWGWNPAGLYGNVNVNTATKLTSLGTGWKSLNSVGTVGSDALWLGLKEDDTLWVWGSSTSVCGGSAGYTTTQTPVQVGSSQWKKIVTSDIDCSVLALRSDDTLWSWGKNSKGQLGIGNKTNTYAPTQIGSSSNWSSEISISVMSGSAIMKDGSLWYWGTNSTYGQLSSASTVVESLTPLQISGAYSSVLRCRNGAAMAIFQTKTNGEVWAHGVGANNRLAQANNNNQYVPVRVGTAIFDQVSKTKQYLRHASTKSIWAWGTNYLSTWSSTTTPSQMLSGSWKSICSGAPLATGSGMFIK